MKSITPRQLKQFSRFVTDASGLSVKIALEQLDKDGQLNREDLQIAIGKGDQLKSRLIPFLKTMIMEMATNVQGCVKRIFDGERIVIGKTDGKQTLANTKDFFTGGVDPDFVNYGCDVKGKPTAEMPVEVFEIVEDGDFARIFGGFNVGHDRLCLSQNQIIQFVKDHSDMLLRTIGCATLFLFKVEDKFFVADVYFDDDGRLKVYVHPFSFDHVWDAEYRRRVVVPQLLALEN